MALKGGWTPPRNLLGTPLALIGPRTVPLGDYLWR
jgi:hypothetical protein